MKEQKERKKLRRDRIDHDPLFFLYHPFLSPSSIVSREEKAYHVSCMRLVYAVKTWKVREGNLSQLHPPSTLMILHLVAFYTAKTVRDWKRGSWIEIRNGNWSVVFGWLLHASFIRMKLNQNLSFSVPCFSLSPSLRLPIERCVSGGGFTHTTQTA